MAETYPSRPVRLIVFVPPGGVPDIVARLIGQSLSLRLGQPVIIENRPGAGGNIALGAVKIAAPDGYTLLFAANPHAINTALYANSELNLIRDIAPVAGIIENPLFMVSAPSLPVRTLPEFIAYAKANPGKLNMASTGTGDLSHMAEELFKMMTGVEMVHVPYRGAEAVLNAVMAGEAHMTVTGGSVVPLVQAGRVCALAVTGTKRWQALPDIPTVAEFVPNYVVYGWCGLGAPKATPPEIIDKLNKDVDLVLAEPGIKARFAELFVEPLPGSPDDLRKHIAADTEKWAQVIRTANIKIQ